MRTYANIKALLTASSRVASDCCRPFWDNGKPEQNTLTRRGGDTVAYTPAELEVGGSITDRSGCILMARNSKNAPALRLLNNATAVAINPEPRPLRRLSYSLSGTLGRERSNFYFRASHESLESREYHV